MEVVVGINWKISFCQSSKLLKQMLSIGTIIKGLEETAA